MKLEFFLNEPEKYGALYAVRILSFFIVGVLLVSACIGFGGLSTFPKVSKIEVSHSHEHSHDGHSHEDQGADHDSGHSSKSASSQDAHTHTHTIIVAVQGAVVVPKVIENVLVPKSQDNYYIIGEAQPPVDPFLGSIFRPPISA